MQLSALLQSAGITADPSSSLPLVEVRDVRYDSRQVGAGDLFVAVPGTATDGHLHVDAAIAAGAVAVVVERADACRPAVPCLVVPSGRAALADLAAAFHRYPSRR